MTRAEGCKASIKHGACARCSRSCSPPWGCGGVLTRRRLVVHVRSVDDTTYMDDDDDGDDDDSSVASGNGMQRRASAIDTRGTTVTAQGIQALVRRGAVVFRCRPRFDVTVAGVSAASPLPQASLLSQPMSPMFTVRSLSISGLYLSYESMATLAYRILVRSRAHPGCSRCRSCSMAPRGACVAHGGGRHSCVCVRDSPAVSRSCHGCAA